MFVYFGLILTLGIFLTFILYLPFSWPVRLSLTLLSFVFATRVAILRFFFGGIGGIEAPKTLLLLTSFFQGLLVLLFLLALFRLIAIGLGVLGSLGPWPGAKFLGSLKGYLLSPKASIALLTLAALLSASSLYQAAKVPELVKSEVAFKAWPKSLDGLTVAILADAHISRFFDRPWVEAVVEKTMAAKPDLILLPGDMVDGSVEQRANDVAPLAKLKAPLGVFAIVGNHEYYSGFNAWVPVFEKLGLTMLCNSHAVIMPQGVPLVVAGLTDLTALESRFRLAGPDLAKALEGAPNAPIILMEHRPVRARQNAKADPRIFWQISGHTHGGMLPILKSVVKKVNDGFVVGWYDLGQMKLFTQPGLGLWNGFPMRLFDPSEITFLTIHSI
ncbi:MAG: metallophosphoesterase [Deltaproteobacteria bacterium]|jgi:predicted MPP superfamily phosphohydrolase|nr:metallophosphoesterase [Deltaproteobacteria bacterium]